ncbi:MAG: isoamylase early set domain-containing protein [bacterium]
MVDEDDVLLDRVLASLRVLPRVDEAAMALLLVAVAAERERDRERSRATRPRWAVGAAGIAAAAAIVAALTFGHVRRERPPSREAASATAAPTAARLATDAVDAAIAPRPVEIVLRAPAATSVRVVGDFNGWDKSRAPMTRDAASGLWSATLSVRPGRHVYAFVVDDSLWMRDPRAPAAKDEDFGRPGSVLLVGRP